MIEALGGTVIDYAGVYKCCGFPIITMNKKASLTQAGRHLGDAIDAEADCLVVPCPLCHLNLDMQQPAAAKVVGRELGMPVLHLPQLVGLALGPLAQGAGHEQARRQADLGDRLVDVGGRGRSRLIGPLRRLFGRSRPSRSTGRAGDGPGSGARSREDATRRLEAARSRAEGDDPAAAGLNAHGLKKDVDQGPHERLRSGSPPARAPAGAAGYQGWPYVSPKAKSSTGLRARRRGQGSDR